jgi:hypothetical protein
MTCIKIVAFGISEVEAMGSEQSDEMMVLLQEKAVLKQLDEEYAVSPRTQESIREYRQRRRRQAEISKQMRELGKAKKD